MAKHHRVTEICYGEFWDGDDSILARERGKKLHSLIANQYRGQGYVEVPQVLFLADKQGNVKHVISGTPDLYNFKKDQLTLIDHKTISLKAKPYGKKEWWNQLLLYHLMIYCDQRDSKPSFKITASDFGVWLYRRYLTNAESLKIDRKLANPFKDLTMDQLYNLL